MNARFPVAALAALLATTAVRAAAQVGSTGANTGPTHTCNACHTPHPKSTASANLRIGPSAVIAAYRLPGLDGASASCLRCHATAEIREREAAREWGQVRVLEGKFLGYDLSDDHPLGRVKGKVVDRLTLVRPLLEAEREATNKAEPPLIECSSCHDPHDRTEGLWNPANDGRCAACHDEHRYRLTSHSALSCENCHHMHGGNVPALLAERDGDLLCTTCHVTPGRTAGSPDLTRSISALPGHVVSTAERCAKCHPPHGAG